MPNCRAKPPALPRKRLRLKTLEAQIETGNSEVSDFFRKTLYPQLAQKAGAQDGNALLSKEKSEVSRLQNTLAEAGTAGAWAYGCCWARSMRTRLW